MSNLTKSSREMSFVQILFNRNFMKQFFSIELFPSMTHAKIARTFEIFKILSIACFRLLIVLIFPTHQQFPWTIVVFWKIRHRCAGTKLYFSNEHLQPASISTKEQKIIKQSNRGHTHLTCIKNRNSKLPKSFFLRRIFLCTWKWGTELLWSFYCCYSNAES